MEYEALQADISEIMDADGTAGATFGYQWVANDGSGDSDIEDGTARNYTVTRDDVGKAILVRVSFLDDRDNEEALTSEPTAAVAAAANRPPTGLPAISGTPKVQETLTATTSEISDEDGLINAHFGYQWLADLSDIEDATDSSYTLTPSDQGKRIRLRVTFTDDRDTEETLTSESTDAVKAANNRAPVGLPEVSGTPQVGRTLTASTAAITDADGLNSASFTYQWVAGASDIQGATGSTHTLTAREQGLSVMVRVSFTDDAGNQESLISPPTGPVAATTPGAPQHLHVFSHNSSALDAHWHPPASDGGGNVTGYKVQWKQAAASWDDAAGVFEATVTGTSHIITGLAKGVEYSVRVKAVNDIGDGSPSAEELATPAEKTLWRATLTAGTVETFAGYTTFLTSEESHILGTLTPDSFTSKDGPHTVGALGVLDGKLILTVNLKLTAEFVLVVGRKEFASTDASTYESTAITQYQWDNPGLNWTDEELVNVRLTKPQENLAATGAPRISGTPQEEQTLTADTSGITDADGLTGVSFEYQWLASGADINGATGPSFTLTAGQQGQTIQVRVTFTDNADNEETLTSVATVAVAAAPNREATGEPTIGGTPRVGQTLTAETSPIDDVDGLTNVSYEYQWLAGGSDIAGATGSTYGLVPADTGSTIEVRVSFTDDRGNSETLTSEATVAVAAKTPTEPLSLTVATGDQVQELVASWRAPESNGGSNVTGYRVQWKEVADSWDTEADVYEATETGTTHTIAGLTGGVQYAVRVIATNSAGDGPASAEAAGTPTGGVPEQVVEPENSAPTGLPGISGTPKVDETLTADTSEIDDADGLTSVSYEYQWIAGDSDIAGATGSTYTLTYGEQGKTIQVRVTFTDDADNTETLTSAATVAVAAAPNREATGKPGVDGTPRVEETLTADTSGITDEDGLDGVSYEYQWTAGGTDIAGATGSSFTLTSSEEGETVQVRVTFTDDRGNSESLTSEATAAVAAKPVPLTAALTGVPANHSGAGTTFQFTVTFSENIRGGYAKIRDRAFTLSGADITQARRSHPQAEDRNRVWTITVKVAAGHTGAVTLTLPATTDCGSARAICTFDNRMLSHSLSFTVPGPGG